MNMQPGTFPRFYRRRIGTAANQYLMFHSPGTYCSVLVGVVSDVYCAYATNIVCAPKNLDKEEAAGELMPSDALAFQKAMKCVSDYFYYELLPVQAKVSKCLAEELGKVDINLLMKKM